MRKTVWIPVVAMANRAEGTLLELIIERGAWCNESALLANLRLHGLANAAQLAEQALQHARLLPQFSWLYGKCAPYCYLSNPVTGLSNTSGAALGIALGLLMYEGNLPNRALIVSGGLLCQQNNPQVELQYVDKVAEKLELALRLPRPAQPLGFVLPTHTQTGFDIQHTFADQIQALRHHNIHVLPNATLQAAINACRQLELGL